MVGAQVEPVVVMSTMMSASRPPARLRSRRGFRRCGKPGCRACARRTAASSRQYLVAMRSRRPWRWRKSAATSSRSAMVSTSSQTSGTATTTSARAEAEAGHDLGALFPVGQRLAQQVLAGDAEVDAACAELAGDLGGRQEDHLDVGCAGNAARGICARRSGSSTASPARANSVERLSSRSRPLDGSARISVTAVPPPQLPRCGRARPRSRRRGSAAWRRAASAAGRSGRRRPAARRIIGGNDLEDQAGIVVERPAECGVIADHGGRQAQRPRSRSARAAKRPSGALSASPACAQTIAAPPALPVERHLDRQEGAQRCEGRLRQADAAQGAALDQPLRDLLRRAAQRSATARRARTWLRYARRAGEARPP